MFKLYLKDETQYNKYSEDYQDHCYNRAIEELHKMTWEAQTGEVMFGVLFFKIDALKKEIADLKEKLNDSSNS